MTAPNVTVRIVGQEEGALKALREVTARLKALEQAQGKAAGTALSFGRAQAGAGGGLERFVAKIGLAVLAFRALQVAAAGAVQGLRVGASFEQAELGIASLIAAQTKLSDASGRVLEGQEKLTAARVISVKQLQRLRVASLETVATFEQLQRAFQSAVGPGFAAGLNIDQINAFTVAVAQAATAINLPTRQLDQEVRSILEGSIDVNSRLAKNLKITNEQVKLERERGTLATFLTQKFEQFALSGKAAALSFEGIKTNLQDAFNAFAQVATKPLFEKLKQTGQAALLGVFDINTAKLTPAFAGLASGFQDIFGALGTIIQKAIGAAVAGLKAISTFVNENRTAITAFENQVGDAAKAVLTLVLELGKVVASLVVAAVKSGLVAAAFTTIRQAADLATSVVRGVRDAFAWASDNKIVVGIIAITAAVAKLITFIGGLSALPTAIGLAGLAVLANPLVAIAVAAGAATVGLNLLTEAQQRARLSQIAAAQASSTAAASELEMSKSFAAQARALDEKKKKGEDVREAQARLLKAQADLVSANPAYRKAIQGAGDDYARLADLVDQVSLAIVRQEAAKATQLASRVTSLRKQKADLESQFKSAALPSLTPLGVLRSGTGAVVGQIERVTTELTAAEAALKTTFDLLVAFGKKPTADPKITPLDTSTTPGESAATARANAKAAVDATIATAIDLAKRVLALTQSNIKDQAQANEIANAQGLLRLSDYFDKRVEIVRAGTAAEVRALEVQLAVLKAEPIIPDGEGAGRAAAARAKREREIADLLDQILLKRKEGAREERAIDAERITAAKELATAIEDAESRIQAARGETATATQRSIQKEAEAFNKLLTQQGVGFTERAIRVRILFDTLSTNAAFESLQKDAQRALDTLARERQRINTLADTGSISQREAQRQILALEQARRPVLAGIANQVRAASAALGPEQQDEAAKFADEIVNIGVAVNRVQLLSKNAGGAIRDSFESSLSDVFGRLGSDITTLGDAFRALAQSVVQSIQRIVGELLAAQIVQGIGSLLGGGGKINNIVKGFSGGGFVTGPGTGTSDSIPARLSAGEYVVRAAAVRRVGISALEALNGLRTPTARSRVSGVQAFADGGLVTASAGARGEMTATIGLEEGLFVKGLTSRAGESAQLDTIRKNARTIRAVLGL